jgi:hypothetical protein
MVRFDVYMPAVWVPGLGFHDISMQMHSGSCGINGGTLRNCSGLWQDHVIAVVFVGILLVSPGGGILRIAEKSVVSVTSIHVS